MKIRVRSIFTKIVVWFTVTVVLSLVGFVTTSVLLSQQLLVRDPVFPRLQGLLLDDARRAFEEGGPPQLAAFLARLKSYTDSESYLTDAAGSTWSVVRIGRACWPAGRRGCARADRGPGGS